MKPFSLYVHIPYCDSKCPYCDFNSYAVREWPEEEYASALIAEMDSYGRGDPWRGRPLATVFLGGGTPSLFAPTTVRRILDAAFSVWPRGDVSQDRGGVEVTLEANPGTVNRGKLRGFVDAGIDRLSFGVQSFHERHLRSLGRIHDAAEAIEAVALARESGVPEISLDLMFGVPGQTLDEWEVDLGAAIGLGVDHISAYNLTYEEGTAFWDMRRKAKLRPAPEDVEVAMFRRTREILAGAGYLQYEISNYAQPGSECRHNLNYWNGGEYLGVGAGAHSFSRGAIGGRRWSNERTPRSYLERIRDAGQARVFEEELSAEQARGEYVFLGLRCRAGIEGEEFRRRFGVEFSDAFPHVAVLQQDGWIENDAGCWRLTDRGLLFADSLFATFV